MSACPDGSYDYVVGNCTEGNLMDLKENILCDKFVKREEIISCKVLDGLMNTKRCAKRYVPTKSCMLTCPFLPAWYLTKSLYILSTSVSKICLPSNDEDIIDTLNKTLLADSFRIPILVSVKEVWQIFLMSLPPC